MFSEQFNRNVVRGEHATDFDKWIRASSIADYVSQRQNADGGYTFAQWSESSAQDTYYAIEILKMLGLQSHRRETTISFLQKLQQADGSFDSIKVAYYVTRSLKKLGTRPGKGVEEYVLLPLSTARTRVLQSLC
jgi:hypothetical protein